ncbi:endolytic transglycosylase MltG [Cryobacterium tagatosivorans]|uniref:Endolytic murein transglycosylase n=1 Tax=Cryobacterium tagatosivorans TaxID=1259199 RepID=A0A4R8UJC7_9MICO|nr:endolytic transglycosylase MltG [Cryobacterium tagatosivorans]
MTGATETQGGGPGAASASTPADAAGSRRAARESRGGRSGGRAEAPTGPRRVVRSRRGAWGCLAVLLVFVALLAVAAVILQGPIAQLFAATQGPADYEGTGDKELVVMIHEGDTGEDVAAALAKADVVKSYAAFYKLLLAESPAPVFQPGAYQLATKMSARSALDALLDKKNKLEHTVVIPEGTTAAVALQSLSEGTEVPLADIQAAAKDVASFGLPAEATSLEGFVFPATYNFTPGVTAHDAIKTLVDRQFKALDDAGVTADKRWTTITMAALIQREAGLREDYYKVSRVFYNRLNPQLWPSGLLQSDATVTYRTGNTHLATTTDSERADAGNPYNTYVHPGLPAGPISNPGDLAIDAALHPADGPWLYFVSWNLDTGETIFSATLKDHEVAVAKWLAWMKDHPEYG